MIPRIAGRRSPWEVTMGPFPISKILNKKKHIYDILYIYIKITYHPMTEGVMTLPHLWKPLGFGLGSL